MKVCDIRNSAILYNQEQLGSLVAKQCDLKIKYLDIIYDKVKLKNTYKIIVKIGVLYRIMNKDIDIYLKEFEGDSKEWLTTFVEHMRNKYPQLEEVISFKMPTYKLGSGKERNYIAFSVGKNHFSLHTMDFEYINVLREKLSKPGKGKGCVNVPFKNVEEQGILFDAIDEIIKRKVTKVYGQKA